jgi:hypothetical protein
VFYAGLTATVVAAVAGMFPVWKSRRLSPASIERRTYWTGCIVGSLLVFFSQLPDWWSGLIITSAIVFVMVGTAWRFTSHVKIGNRIYAASHHKRRPDPPPALGE